MFISPVGLDKNIQIRTHLFCEIGTSFWLRGGRAELTYRNYFSIMNFYFGDGYAKRVLRFALE